MKDMRFLKVFVSYVILVLLTLAVLDFFLTPKIRDILTQNIEDRMIGTATAVALLPGKDLDAKVPDIARQLGMRATYMGELKKFLDGVHKACADVKADYTLCNTQTPLELSLSEYLHRRSQLN